MVERVNGNARSAVADLAHLKSLPVDFLRGLEVRDLAGGAVVIPYFDETGELLFERHRNRAGAGPRFVQPKGVKLQPYGLNRLEAAHKASLVYVCEGETDAWTLWHCGLPALGIPGAGAARSLEAEHVASVTTMYLLPDNDRAGEQFVEGIRRRLNELVYEGRLCRVGVPASYKDVSDWYVAAGSRDNFLKELMAAVQRSTPLRAGARQPSRNGVAFSDSPLSANAGEDAAECDPAERPVAHAEQETPKKSAATRIVQLTAAAGVALSHTTEQVAYAAVPAGDRVETWQLRTRGFRNWTRRLYYTAEGKAAGAQAVEDALGVLESKALFDGPELPVYVRAAEHEGRIYLDLADPEWRAVEVRPDGWHIITRPPVRFRRPKGMLPLPAPTGGGRLEDLRRFVNVADDAGWRLLAAWLLAALRPRGPYPVLVLSGQQGSAKSTAARVLRSLIDPNAAPLRSEPQEPRDLMIAANNGWLVALDNLSGLPGWLSDALCRLATGGGFSTRELYSDAEETIFDAMRPCLLTGIEDLATRGDLLERSILLSLPPILEHARRAERVFWRDFEAVRPRLLGALLDAVAGALRELPGVRLDRLPRMADFAEWAVAGERALGWPAGSFEAAYRANRQEANETALEASPLVPFVRRFVEAAGK
jgi:hypothetical protein